MPKVVTVDFRSSARSGGGLQDPIKLASAPDSQVVWMLQSFAKFTASAPDCYNIDRFARGCWKLSERAERCRGKE